MSVSVDSSSAASLLRGSSGATPNVTSASITFDTLQAGARLYLGDTHDCWECCAGARDIVQFSRYQRGSTAEWVNSTVALSLAGVLTAVPTVAGPYLWMRYAPHTWPQCAVFDATNQMPTEPFLYNLTSLLTGAGTATTMQQEPAAVWRYDGPRLTDTYVPVAQRGPRTWQQWKGRTIPPAPPPGVVAPVPPAGFNSWWDVSYRCSID